MWTPWPAAKPNDRATAPLTTTTPGDLLAAFVASDSPLHRRQASRVTGGGVTWSFVGRVNSQPGGAEIWTARAIGVLNGANITAETVLRGWDETITVVAFKNSGGIGHISTAAAPTGAPSVSVTSSQANSWVWAVGDDWLASVHRIVPAGQTLVHEATDSVGDTYWVQSTDAPTTTAGTTVTIGDTAPTADPYNMVAVEILGTA